MKILFLAGVEGCGHHMIRAILHNFLMRKEVIDEGIWHHELRSQVENQINLKTNRWFHDRSNQKMFYQSKEMNKTVDRMLDEYAKQGISHLFESASYPYGNPRNPLRRFDLLDFIELFSHKCDVRILLLFRNPVSVVYSAYRRDITRNIMLQAKIVEDNLIFLNSQLGQCSGDHYKTLTFEKFLENPTKYTAALSNWWGIPLPELEKGIEALRAPTQVHEIPQAIKNALEVFFSPKRRQQWPILTANRNNLLRAGM